jgi:hypothetical protein
VRFSLWLAAVFISVVTTFAQNAVSNWFPIHVGDKWVYEHISRINKGGGQAHPDVHTWKTEEITIGSWTVPEGTVVGRQVRVIEGAPPPDAALSPSPTLTAAPSPAYLIRGECLRTRVRGGWLEPVGPATDSGFSEGAKRRLAFARLLFSTRHAQKVGSTSWTTGLGRNPPRASEGLGGRRDEDP